jgi:hypothetical protein
MCILYILIFLPVYSILIIIDVILYSHLNVSNLQGRGCNAYKEGLYRVLYRIASVLY